MTWHKTRSEVRIVSNLATRELEAWLGGVLLWSTPPGEPGSADEVAEFFTTTLIRLLDVVEGMSAHERMDLLGMVAAPSLGEVGVPPGHLLGPFPA